METDPIESLRNYILEQGMAAGQELDELEKAAQQKIEDAVTFAQNSPFPEKEELYTDTWV